MMENDASAWSGKSLDQIYDELHSGPHGLSAAEAEARLVTFGPNRLQEKPPLTIWTILFHQFQSPLILILLVSVLAVIASGEYEDALFIGIVLVLNAVLGTSQEFRAERGSQRLKQFIRVSVKTQRDNKLIEIDAENLVPGDIVHLESGNLVPADLRLTGTYALEVDESVITGESVAVSKDSVWLASRHLPLGDIQNMLFAGTIVTRGRASGIVVATANRTELGRIAKDLLDESAGVPPLVKRMKSFSSTIAIGVVVISLFLAAYEFVVHKVSIRNAFEFSIALAISSIPEGLPIALTITLAVASLRMSKRNAIVRRLAAVEGLGSCTLIATDKTGTLTCNELTIRKCYLPDNQILNVTGEGLAIKGMITNGEGLVVSENESLFRLVRCGVLCNEADLTPKQDGTLHHHGDAVDLAFLVLGYKCGNVNERLSEENRLVHKIPYEPELQFAATWHYLEDSDQTLTCVKGAPERVLDMCLLGEGDRNQFLQSANLLASEGYRVIALADRLRHGSVAKHQLPETPEDLDFLGCVGIIDPPRHGVRKAIAQCHRAGVGVAMITGDHRLTAHSIARDLGLVSEISAPEQSVFTGEDRRLDSIAELRGLIHNGAVFARVSPRQKLQLVLAAQQNGDFVAVTGDGANDAPALRAANIAIAMGRTGSDVARDSADLILSDDNFTTIVAGIEEGRIAYDNIRKVVILLVSTGVGEILMVVLSLFTGYPLPLLPLQLLWLNVATEAIQDEALAFEPNEGDVMDRPPRPPSEPIFNQLMIERILVGAGVMGFLGFGLFAWMIENGFDVKYARNCLLLLMVLFENVHIGNCRSELKSAFKLSIWRNPLLILGVVLALAVHVMAMYQPWFQRVLRVGPVHWQMWLVLVCLAISILPAVECHKWYCRYRIRKSFKK